MAFLNYHHLRYFWAVAQEGNLTRAAEKLHLSQSALSVQLRKLEEQLGHNLFERENRKLTLTEVGRIVLDYAETIFKTGDELQNLLRSGQASNRQVLRVGAVATLSRNFQLDFLKPVMGRTDLELVVRSGTLRELLSQLDAHTLDLVLSNMPVPRDAENLWHSHLLAQQRVSLVRKPAPDAQPFQFPEDLRTVPIVLPSLQSDLRREFDLILEQAGIRPTILAEVDDMAMLRLLARETPGVTLVPPVVVQDELRTGALVECCKIRDLQENFYAITQSRRFPNPLVAELIQAIKAD
ncbi:LysR family transcriptional regulator [Deinococcus cellulosilyticus]|uniref:LysR family transcriptional regulator n=1 Tax=Deinococcus cellulosilyticus (strain DSM 18568 / NBRC 106333 / KACC 11606 / 5516J-15) TaxID=1223518 RepID=A0A511NAI5_DEIC1|nr:LysR family transcriptional regulator [Deinococcus cellulosilyticus]GEM49508.1 LysR family transcriptional regulator [Deinococcus cellulosilyticus NBRC 106333 = KACC 11606]